MRVLKKLIVFSFIFILFACKSDDDDGNQFILSYENIAGVYDLVHFSGTIETMIDVEGILVPAVITIVGDTFQVDAMFNQNRTYSIEGEYRTVTTVTVGGISETNSEIVIVNDTGSFQIDANEQTITISSDLDDDFGGTFDVTLFNETEIRLVQEETNIENDITIDSIFELRFIRQ